MPKKSVIIECKKSLLWKIVKNEMLIAKMKYYDNKEEYDFYAFHLAAFHREEEAKIEKEADKKNLQKDLKSYKVYYLKKLKEFVKNLEKEKSKVK